LRLNRFPNESFLNQGLPKEVMRRSVTSLRRQAWRKLKLSLTGKEDTFYENPCFEKKRDGPS
jgi:hypothetical protein